MEGVSSRMHAVMVHEPAVLIEGVLFRARYLGSTQLSAEGRATKTARMMQAQEAVARVKAPEGEIQPSTDIDLFISTEKIMVLNTDLQVSASSSVLLSFAFFPLFMSLLFQRISDTDVRQVSEKWSLLESSLAVPRFAPSSCPGEKEREDVAGHPHGSRSSHHLLHRRHRRPRRAHGEKDLFFC